MKRPNVVASATRMKITPAQQSVMTQALIETGGGDTSKVATSYAVADRARRKTGKIIADKVKSQWQVPDLITLHWDSKLMPRLTDANIVVERLAVVVGDSDQLKLLGVPQYEPGTDQSTGELVSKATCELLQEWKCVDNVVNMTFDTTASNTGHISAACISIQEKLDRSLLWSGCRHHVGELIITHIFNDLKIEVSKSPNVTLFKSNYSVSRTTPTVALCPTNRVVRLPTRSIS